MTELVPQIGIGQWIGLSFDTRQELVKMFSLTRSAGTVVENGILKTDGYTDKDLAAMSVEALQKALESSESNFYSLLDTVLAQIEEKRMGKQKESDEEVAKRKKTERAANLKAGAKMLAQAAKMMEDGE